MAMLLQLSRKRVQDDEFQEVVADNRHFWLQWLHGNKRGQPQAKAVAAAAARAGAAGVAVQNSFDALAGQAELQVISCTANVKELLKKLLDANYTELHLSLNTPAPLRLAGGMSNFFIMRYHSSTAVPSHSTTVPVQRNPITSCCINYQQQLMGKQIEATHKIWHMHRNI